VAVGAGMPALSAGKVGDAPSCACICAWASEWCLIPMRKLCAVRIQGFRVFIFNQVDSACHEFANFRECGNIRAFVLGKVAAKSYIMTHLNLLVRVEARMDRDWRATND
jgi:hypothetical protein